MMFMKLTRVDGQALYLDVHSIQAIEIVDGITRITLWNAYAYVQETPDSILAALDSVGREEMN